MHLCKTLLAITFAAAAGRAPAPLASAQTPAPAPAAHENKISDEASAALERCRRLVYRPVDEGLLEAAGKVSTDGDPEGQPSMHFEFHAPRKVDVAWCDASGARRHPATMIGMVDLALSAAFTGVPVPDEPSYDADLVVERGARVLVIDCYRGETIKSHLRATLDANGLVAAVVMTSPSAPGKTLETRLGWAKVGEHYRLDRMSFPGAGIGADGDMAVEFRYAPVEGFALPSGWTVKATREEQRVSTEFTVEGTTVERR